jgi:hypothetical protein
MKFHNKDYWGQLICRKLHRQFMELDDESLREQAETVSYSAQRMSDDALRVCQQTLLQSALSELLPLICIEKELNRRKTDGG